MRTPSLYFYHLNTLCISSFILSCFFIHTASFNFFPPFSDAYVLSQNSQNRDKVSEHKCMNDEKENFLGIQESATRAIGATLKRDWEQVPFHAVDKSIETKQIVALLLFRILNVLSKTTLESTSAMSQRIISEGICRWPAKVTPAVITSLEYYVSTLMDLHHDVHYHNRKHTFHVFNDANKILDLILENQNNSLSGVDPMLGFGLIFSSLIHDIGHPGISNQVFSIQYPEASAVYNDISPIEQNSLKISFSHLQKPELKPLRDILFGEEYSANYDVKYQRFHSIVTQLVLNTDIFNHDKKIARDDRLEEAYGENAPENKDLKAMVLLENILLAADVGETMRNWESFKSSGDNVFLELKAAFENGKAEYDPESNWFESQIGFLENHCLVLVKKLDMIGLPQQFCDELEKAIHNNIRLWSQEGEEHVKLVVLKWESEKMKLR